ncbi:hypothetical protein B5E48_09210 [Massilimicrobiota sp. An105]|nr:hypothetical protein B5E48_09210 [Massilimicrobiota sp. An105]
MWFPEEKNLLNNENTSYLRRNGRSIPPILLFWSVSVETEGKVSETKDIDDIGNPGLSGWNLSFGLPGHQQPSL